jgi:hypothetical protein
MFSRMLDTYLQSDAFLGPILFDRGIPDILAMQLREYCEISNGGLHKLPMWRPTAVAPNA